MPDQRETSAWRIGEMAATTGVSVRMLRHYDALGLLRPAERTAAGHRLYDDADLERLYRIVALRRLGFSLADIGRVLDGDDLTLTETARRHLQQIEQETSALKEQWSRVAKLLETSDGQAAREMLIDAIEGTAMTIRLDQIYTRRGDDGWTELLDGTRVHKSDARLAPDLEELVAQLGVAVALPDVDEQLLVVLRRIQNELFDLGADLARGQSERGVARVSSDYTTWLETACDEANAELAPLASFVLPGGNALSAQLHVCRIVCRRMERAAAAVEDVDLEAIMYLNRLSDLLFVLARRAGPDAEQLWVPGIAR